MALSALQRFILRECYQFPKPRVPRLPFTKFYARSTHPNADSITVSLERLIDRGFLIGFGRRTPKKWFIEEVKLTSLGRSTARSTYGKQQQFPF
jgi:hypothetical protein